jgi:hypothetical protein
MPKLLEKKLMSEARKKGLAGKRFKAYVWGAKKKIKIKYGGRTKNKNTTGN